MLYIPPKGLHAGWAGCGCSGKCSSMGALSGSVLVCGGAGSRGMGDFNLFHSFSNLARSNLRWEHRIYPPAVRTVSKQDGLQTGGCLLSPESCTWVESPPAPGIPQVTTPPPRYHIAKAPWPPAGSSGMSVFGIT